MIGLRRVTLLTSILFSLFIFLVAPHVNAEQQPESVGIQSDIKKLQENNNCPQCDLSGADLTRMNLSGANLEGANLASAKMFLTNLSGANLKNSNLRGAMFGGADLGNADLRGADLTGASLAGAYMGGTILDGEMLTTTSLKNDDMSPIEETVYVEDTVKPKSLQEPKDIKVESSSDSDDTQPPVPSEAVQPENLPNTNELITEKEVKTTVPERSRELPASKTVPVIQKAKVQEKEVEPQILLVDASKKKLSQNSSSQVLQETAPSPPQEVVEPISETPEQTQGDENGKASVPAEEEGVALVQTEEVVEKRVEVAQEEPIVEEVEETVRIVSATEPIEGADLEVEAVEAISQTPAEPQVSESGQPVAPAEVAEEEIIEAEVAEAVIIAPLDKTAEEDVQDIRVAEQALDNSTIFEPVPEVLQNIQKLLDTNQCYGCNLSGADLSGKNLDGADLEGADLSNALLKNCDLEEANLKGANLSGADLSGADLSEADLYKAILTGADMTNTTLEETLLDDAELSGVKGYDDNLLLIEGN